MADPTISKCQKAADRLQRRVVGSGCSTVGSKSVQPLPCETEADIVDGSQPSQRLAELARAPE